MMRSNDVAIVFHVYKPISTPALKASSNSIRLDHMFDDMAAMYCMCAM